MSTSIIGCSITEVLTPCYTILLLVYQHVLSKKLRAHYLLESYAQRNCEPIAMTQIRVEDLRKVYLGDTELDEMEEGTKMSLQKEGVESSLWDWQNVSVIHEYCLGKQYASSMSQLGNYLGFSKEYCPIIVRVNHEDFKSLERQGGLKNIRIMFFIQECRNVNSKFMNSANTLRIELVQDNY